MLSKFLQDTSTFKGEKLNGTFSPESFANIRTTLVSKLLESISSRYADLESPVIESTSIGNLTHWPKHPEQKDDIEGLCMFVYLRAR